MNVASQRCFPIAAVMMSLLSLSSAAVAADWGDLTGKFVFQGNPPKPEEIKVTADAAVCGKPPALVDESLVVGEDGGLANVLIYVRSRDPKINPELAKQPENLPVIDNKHCRFEPHVQAVFVDHPVLLKNSDPVPHNINVQPIGGVPINPLMAPGQDIEHKFSRAQRIPVPVQCNIHPWMKGYVLPCGNPYFAVSGEDGTFTIKGLPLGEDLEFQAWHEKVGYLEAPNWSKGRFEMKLDKPETDLGVISLPAATFNK